jgi:hypothetical protein
MSADPGWDARNDIAYRAEAMWSQDARDRIAEHYRNAAPDHLGHKPRYVGVINWDDLQPDAQEAYVERASEQTRAGAWGPVR